MTREWLLLIYTVPSQPSRKRASVWRELKKLGAVYLRDGCALLPRRAELEDRMRAMVARIAEFEGTADLVISPHFAAERVVELVQRFQEDRVVEYREVHHASVRFLREVLHEVDADDFSFPDVDKLDSELGRLHRWYGQIEERDYFEAEGSTRVLEILAKCDQAFENFTATASSRGEDSGDGRDDVFERLGGAAAPADPLPDNYPL